MSANGDEDDYPVWTGDGEFAGMSSEWNDVDDFDEWSASELRSAQLARPAAPLSLLLGAKGALNSLQARGRGGG